MLTFEALPGFFEAFPVAGAGAVDAGLGLHTQRCGSFANWRDLYARIPPDTDQERYKLVALARHGQGYHNAAILRYGMEQWNAYWAFLDGDGETQWLDSHLTPLGRNQVRNASRAHLEPLAKELQQLPRFFCSPMRRCIETLTEEWTSLVRDAGPVRIEILEQLRERLGEHTCDKRVGHSVTVQEYQGAQIGRGSLQLEYEPNYSEPDALWRKDHRETDAEMDVRIDAALQQVLANADRFISITSHSGTTQALLRVFKHPAVTNLPTGGIVFCVVRVRGQDTTAAAIRVAAGTTTGPTPGIKPQL
ncbi:LAMI_0G05248g1_1 [Lachancea mirantina]|uniref:LAMI_0G05248g1_1 n=1 Tax=Lachancea mirantina TaxID=1230905 RepID=A0A1G4K8R0_9SACH|nr:LAMI_0G05248g1_1 [Lachancea mirantina]